MNGVEPVQPTETAFTLPPLTGQLSKLPARTSEGVFIPNETGFVRFADGGMRISRFFHPGVYCIYNLITKKHYIGSSWNNIGGRISTHRSRIRAGTHENKKLMQSIKKYGEDAFVCFVVEILLPDKHLCRIRESYWIKKTNAVRAGYNLTDSTFSGLGIDSPQWSEICLEKFYENFGGYESFAKKCRWLMDNGQTQRDAARMLGVASATAREALKWFKIPPAQRGNKNGQIEDFWKKRGLSISIVADHIKSNIRQKSVKQIAEFFAVTSKSINRVIALCGIEKPRILVGRVKKFSAINLAKRSFARRKSHWDKHHQNGFWGVVASIRGMKCIGLSQIQISRSLKIDRHTINKLKTAAPIAESGG